MNDMIVHFKKQDPRAVLPEYASEGASGFDFRACLREGETITIAPGQRALVQTGLEWQPPGVIEGDYFTRETVSDGESSGNVTATLHMMELQIRSRSGLALKKGIAVLNSPGTIDSDYRGPIGIILQNFGHEDFVVNHGDRIAQGVVALAVRVNIQETMEDNETARGAGGFGSTGST